MTGQSGTGGDDAKRSIPLDDFLALIDQGQLSLDELGRGMHLCYLNARDLVEDAEVLLNRRPGRALSLAILAWEELAKILIFGNAASKLRNHLT